MGARLNRVRPLRSGKLWDVGAKTLAGALAAISASGCSLLYQVDAPDDETWDAGPEPTLAFQQEVDGYRGTVDTSLSEGAPNEEQATDDKLEFDGEDSDRGGLETLSLLRFDDVFGTSALPSSTSLLKVTLDVYFTDARGNGFALYTVQEAWQETTTWSTFASGNPETGLLLVDDTFDLDSEGEFPVTIDITSVAQQWHSDPASHHGVAFRAHGPSGNLIGSSEYEELDARPRLNIFLAD